MQGSKLYVGNLSYSATREQIEELFASFGTVNQVNIIEGKGFGFVEMPGLGEAQKALAELNTKEVKGKKLVVNEARPREDNRRSGGGGRGGSGGGGRGGSGGGGRRW